MYVPAGRRTRHTPPIVARREQDFNIDAAGTVTSTLNQLPIPYTSIFDNAHIEGIDIIFTTGCWA